MKTRTNVSVDKALLETAREQGLPISRILEEALRARLAREAAIRWREENHDRIRDYAAAVDQFGVLSDEFRDF